MSPRHESINQSSIQRSRSHGANDVLGKPPRAKRELWQKIRNFCFFLGAIGVAECVAATLTSPRFSVKKVNVIGVKSTPAPSVNRIAQDLVGHNWLRIKARKTVQAMEKSSPKDLVKVHRTIAWPLQLQANVIVHEREPFVLIGGGNQWWEVDAGGIPYRMVSQPNKLPLDAITSPQLHPQLGNPISKDQWENITHLLQNIEEDRQANPQGLQWDLRRIYFDREGNVSLRLKDAAHQELLVRLGSSQWNDKLKRAREALLYFDHSGRRAEELNLISYKVPTWIPRSDQEDVSSVKPVTNSLSG